MVKGLLARKHEPGVRSTGLNCLFLRPAGRTILSGARARCNVRVPCGSQNRSFLVNPAGNCAEGGDQSWIEDSPQSRGKYEAAVIQVSNHLLSTIRTDARGSKGAEIPQNDRAESVG